MLGNTPGHPSNLEDVKPELEVKIDFAPLVDIKGTIEYICNAYIYIQYTTYLHNIVMMH